MLRTRSIWSRNCFPSRSNAPIHCSSCPSDRLSPRVPANARRISPVCRSISMRIRSYRSWHVCGPDATASSHWEKRDCKESGVGCGGRDWIARTARVSVKTAPFVSVVGSAAGDSRAVSANRDGVSKQTGPQLGASTYLWA